MVGRFIVTIIMAVPAHNFLHLPPVLGMMTGLGLLKFFGYYLQRRAQRAVAATSASSAASTDDEVFHGVGENTLGAKQMRLESTPPPVGTEAVAQQFNIFKSLERAELATLMFFYGIIPCVGGLGTLGYLALGSELMCGQLGPTGANILVGVLSAIVDNIPVMFAVLAMSPDMSHGQLLLVTLTAGVGGSMLSIGSAAGVAVMGQARDIYTFFSHLKWTWSIAIGYAASIWTHFILNRHLI